MRLATLLAAMTLTASMAQAGEITKLGEFDSECTYKFEGRVEAGDASKVAELITYGAAGASLCLNSPGGSLPEGLKMFNVIWSKQMHTRVLSGDLCESACAVAWLGGGLDEGTLAIRTASRSIEPGAVLGFHAPALDLPDGGVYPAEQVEEAFRVALKSAEGLFDIKLTTQDNVRALNDFLYGRILATPGDQMFRIGTVAEALMSNVLVSAAQAPEKLLTANLVHLCENAYLVQRGANVLLDGAERHLTLLRRGAAQGERVKYVAERDWVVRMDGARRSQYVCVVSDESFAWYLKQAGFYNGSRLYPNGGPDQPEIPVSLQRVDVLPDGPAEDVWKEIADRRGSVLASLQMPFYALLDGMTPLADLPRH